MSLLMLVCHWSLEVYVMYFKFCNRQNVSPPSRALLSTKTGVFIIDLGKAPGSFALSMSRFITHLDCAVN